MKGMSPFERSPTASSHSRQHNSQAFQAAIAEDKELMALMRRARGGGRRPAAICSSATSRSIGGPSDKRSFTSRRLDLSEKQLVDADLHVNTLR